MYNDLRYEWAYLNALLDARIEALELFDRCVAEGSPRRFEVYIQKLITQNPPPLALLLELTDAIRGRVFNLRQDQLNNPGTAKGDVQIAQILYENLRDWTEALSVIIARGPEQDDGSRMATGTSH